MTWVIQARIILRCNSSAFPHIIQVHMIEWMLRLSVDKLAISLNVVGVGEASSTLSYSINGFNIVDVNIGFNTISCMPDEINKSLNFEHHVAT